MANRLFNTAPGGRESIADVFTSGKSSPANDSRPRRYSLRRLLSIITVACVLFAYMRWQELDQRAFWPGLWTWLGATLAVVAQFVPRRLQTAISVAAVYVFVADAVYVVWATRTSMHSSDGIVRGKPWAIEYVEQACAMLVIYPALAAIPAIYFCWRDRRSLTLWPLRGLIAALANYGLFAYFIWRSIL